MKGIENNGQYSKIEKSTTLKGNIKSKTDIRIDGNVDGEVITTGKIILGKESNVIGKILCGNADVEGKFDGELTVSGTLNLKAGSNVKGKVKIQKLIVESGSIFNANCSMHSAEDGVKKLNSLNEQEKKAEEPMANVL